MNVMRFWPLIAGAIIVILTWATGALQVNQIIETDSFRHTQIKELQQWRIEQMLMNRELKIQHIEIKEYIDLLDSKYSRLCK